MKNLSLSVLTGMIASGAIAAYQPAAQAASFTFNAQDAVSEGCVGQTTCTVNDFFSLEATTARNTFAPVLTQKTVGLGANAVLGIGIDSSKNKNSNPAGESGRTESQGEIDIDEILNVGFKKVGVLSALDLSFLYKPGSRQYGDDVFEAALVTLDDKTQSGTLTVKNETTAIWSLGGSDDVINLSLSRNGFGGSYRIVNPFGDLKIKGFSLTGFKSLAKDKDGNLLKDKNGKPYYPAGSKNSDFALSRVEVTKVPEPATLLGLGVVGLAALTRRRQVAKAD
ncbi:PEP-CTERM sorting domain-containing protein [Leptolyngbya sp. NIES-2104]|uniref:PEP-CTERM sorting domain-containing protein n=1 Tax=Leptolyngbya sp. NIES-2104 TaxID=1552121 RepID=UPI0006EC76A6|nr:PEP-CTERM sorting domain-containing protein [Leptolyngbya sp. NIES-2104]GAP97159.1 hypothetical protein NIES2104_37060 [Leptolyngbya sp. NIES-2104]